MLSAAKDFDLSLHQDIKTPHILVVDDSPDAIRILAEALYPDYEIIVATDGQRALDLALQQPGPVLVMLDIMMPGMGGYEVCRQLKMDPRTADIPVIFTTALTNVEDERYGFSVGASDYITKPFSPPVVRARVNVHVALFEQSKRLQQRADIHTNVLHQSRLEVIRGLGRAAQFKDNETSNHILRMSHYAQAIAEALQVPKRWSQLLLHTAPMHDIGKIGIPDHILNKPGKLNSQEWELMKRHCQYGAEILGDHVSEPIQLSKVIALTHHEKWDGSGYPQGLKEKEIPLAGRIVAVADVFDALTSQRNYKEAWSTKDALAYIDKASGSHFDPNIVDRFQEVLPQILTIKEQYREGDDNVQTC